MMRMLHQLILVEFQTYLTELPSTVFKRERELEIQCIYLLLSFAYLFKYEAKS